VTAAAIGALIATVMIHAAVQRGVGVVAQAVAQAAIAIDSERRQCNRGIIG
jgi:hypothetical protein